MQQKNKAILEILACAALWSTAGIFMKKIPWSPFAIAALRSLLAGLVAVVYLRATKQRFVFTRRSLFGGVTLGATMLIFCVANKLTTAANAIVFQYTDPVFIMLISALFFGQKFTKGDVIAVIVTFLGISLFFFDKLGSGRAFGNAVALCSGVTFACYYISLGGSPENERMSSIVIANAMTFLVGLPFVFLTQPDMSGLPLLFICLLGIFQLGIPYVLLAKGSGSCPPLACSLLGALEPLLNPVWVFLFDGEAPGVFALAGGLVVIATITIWCIWSNKREAAEVKGA